MNDPIDLEATGSDSYQSDLCPELIELRKTEFLNQLAEANREEIEKATQLQKEYPRWFVEKRKQLTASMVNLEEYANYKIRHLEVQQ
ncbi:hypothetical protein ILUMI_13075 [Ignelater luminosus]|uniref:Uncharacterized protein n=1 Tax=Ignelater luminosus TaxID=2038154 RepID=A0A8K0CT01_IGNLU|nr:hypothetical protein ILUMI_13075 [Ignelater luminosus]